METSFGEKKKKNRPPSGWNEGRKVGAAGQKEKYISSRHRPRLTRTTREKFRVGLIIADDGAMRVQGTKTLSSGTRPTSKCRMHGFHQTMISLIGSHSSLTGATTQGHTLT